MKMKNMINQSWKVSMLGALCMLSMNVFAGEKVNELVETQVKGKVTVDVMSGNVVIKAWDKNQVKITGELSDDADGYTIQVDEDGEVYFKVNMPQNRWGNWNDDGGSQLEIMMPDNNSLRFEGVNVDVNAQGIKGGTKLNTVNGDIKAANLNNRIALGTVNGSINAKGLTGKINLNTVNGEIDDQGSQGELEIETVNGEIETDTSATEIGISSVNGEIKIKAKLVDELEVSTVNGYINATLSLNKNARFNASSVGGGLGIYFDGDVSANFNVETHAGGDITNRLTKDKSREAKYGPGESLRFRMGTGSAEVQIDTVSGDVTLNKK
ncbi:MAG: DUF4097 and DUF4098 domain-containing protein YvlB [Psychrosphaera sp.]|jgi:molybdopterin-binding protein